MAFTDSDIHNRFNDAVRATTQQVLQGADPYNAAAALANPKPAFANYAADVMAPIVASNRIVQFYNQQSRQTTTVTALAQGWLLPGSNAAWVHCYSANVPNPSTYRSYVCADLAYAGTLLGFCLQGYPAASPLYFKVAAHDEARGRNDTIVAWHATLADAQAWLASVRNNQAQMLGNAPAGTYGGLGNTSIGIDGEQPGQTSTLKIAQAATQAAQKHIDRNYRSGGGNYEV